jgi:hypothetical protein
MPDHLQGSCSGQEDKASPLPPRFIQLSIEHTNTWCRVLVLKLFLLESLQSFRQKTVVLPTVKSILLFQEFWAFLFHCWIFNDVFSIETTQRPMVDDT